MPQVCAAGVCANDDGVGLLQRQVVHAGRLTAQGAPPQMPPQGGTPSVDEPGDFEGGAPPGHAPGDVEGQPDIEEVRRLVQELMREPDFIPQFSVNETRDWYPECHLQDGECPISDMELGIIYRVFPRAESGAACIDPTSKFFFEVRRGDPNKLMLQFQGGGACFNYFTVTEMPNSVLYNHYSPCVQQAIHTPWEGIFDDSNEGNPYRDYSVVNVMYCSGDIFTGDTERPWGPKRSMVQIRGYRNANAAVEWALGQFPALSHFVFGGQSAGSLGSQWWADNVLTSFADRNAQTVVLPDSFTGVLNPPRVQEKMEGALHEAWGMCETPLLGHAESQRCRETEHSIFGRFIDAMRNHRNVRFAMLNSKTDRLQILFERLLASTLFNLKGVVVPEWMFYRDMNRVFRAYAEEPNWLGYLVDGKQHTFTKKALAFTTTPLGPDADEGSPKLMEWIASLSSFEGMPQMTCLGKHVDIDETGMIFRGLKYCDSGLMGRWAPNPLSHELNTNESNTNESNTTSP